MTVCPTCGCVARLRRAGKPVLESCWEADAAGRVSAVVREWRSMQKRALPVVGGTIAFWQSLESLSCWYELFHSSN